MAASLMTAAAALAPAVLMAVAGLPRGGGLVSGTPRRMPLLPQRPLPLVQACMAGSYRGSSSCRRPRGRHSRSRRWGSGMLPRPLAARRRPRRPGAASVCFHLPPPRGGAALPTQCRVLFSKQLSASDVGKMGRIIVPRACGERWKGSGMVLLLDGGPSHALLLHTPQLHLYCHVHTHPPPSNLPRPPKPHSLLLHLQPSSTCRTVPPARM